MRVWAGKGADGILHAIGRIDRDEIDRVGLALRVRCHLEWMRHQYWYYLKDWPGELRVFSGPGKSLSWARKEKDKGRVVIYDGGLGATHIYVLSVKRLPGTLDDLR